jgi:hypothetical protein
MGGVPAMDHGYAIFNHVRIPKEHMLSKFAQVTKEGKYVQPPHAKLSYGGVRRLIIQWNHGFDLSNRCFIFGPREFSRYSEVYLHDDP